MVISTQSCLMRTCKLDTSGSRESPVTNEMEIRTLHKIPCHYGHILA